MPGKESFFSRNRTLPDLDCGPPASRTVGKHISVLSAAWPVVLCSGQLELTKVRSLASAVLSALNHPKDWVRWALWPAQALFRSLPSLTFQAHLQLGMNLVPSIRLLGGGEVRSLVALLVAHSAVDRPGLPAAKISGSILQDSGC